MRDWKKVEDIWINFCQENNLTLAKRERNYVSGKSQYYSTVESSQDFNISYNHRFEKPDIDIRPEELIITLESKSAIFKVIEIKKRGFFSSIVNSTKIKINGDFNIQDRIHEIVLELIEKYPTAKIRSSNNKISMTLNEFPKSGREMELLRDTLIKISTGIIKKPATNPS